MDHTYESSTVEMDHGSFDALKNQLLNSKTDKQETNDIRDKQETPISAKKYLFRKGDQELELDEDYEIEIMADKKATKLTLKELKDRAAGDIAIKNRMHSLAEEKKKVQSTFKEFATLAKTDPLAALEYISNKANESDSEFEYSSYIEKLADQAEKIGKMSDEQRKALELEKKLAKAEKDLSQKERTEAVVHRKTELLTEYPEIGDQQFGEMIDAILDSDELLDGLENEQDVMNKVEELIQETLTQRDIMTVIQEINPAYLKNDQLIFYLSDQVKQNPDLDEDDIRDIIEGIIGKERSEERNSVPTERERDIRTLSKKARQSAPMTSLKMQNAEPYDVLKQLLLEKKEELQKTPLYKR